MAVKLAPPWSTYNKMVKVLLDDDPDINVSGLFESDGDEKDYDYAFNIEVKDQNKFLALNKVLDPYVEFGNVVLKQILVDKTEEGKNPYVELYETIFTGNPHLKDIKEVKDPAGVIHCYVRFEPEVLQFYNDDLTDYNGNRSCLAENVAYEIFSKHLDPSVNFCTADIRENDGSEAATAPLGEWP